MKKLICKIKKITAVTLCLLFLSTAACGINKEPETMDNQISFNNKLSENGNDPWIILHNNAYYYCFSGMGGVCVAKSDNLNDVATAKASLVWTPDEEEYSKEIWAPELHFLGGKWYIYVAADNGENDNHRMLCLEGKSENPMDGFISKGVLRAETDRWAIDGTAMEYGGKLYFIWSGWEGNENVSQNIYIALMENPWTISGERVLISRPTYSWERIGTPYVNEGPTALDINGKMHIIYSASGSWTDDYCLGMLTLDGDPMDAGAWEKDPDSVFCKTGSVFGPGHASFTFSPDGSRRYIAYHANEESGSSWGGRKLWVQEYTIDENNDPVFGSPMPAGTMQTVPNNKNAE